MPEPCAAGKAHGDVNRVRAWQAGAATVKLRFSPYEFSSREAQRFQHASAN
jgi:hypothetical protein